MAGFNEVLVTLLLVLGAVFIIFSIIISIKLLYTVDKLNIILTDMEKKLKSVNGVFTAIDTVTDAIVTVSDSFVSKALLFFEKYLKKKK